MVKEVIVLDTPGCAYCAEAESFIEKLKKDKKLKFKLKIIDVTKNPEILQKYTVFSAPGIVIDGKLFSTGPVNKTLLEKELLK